MFDLHVHTNNSHDSRQTIDEVCLSAISGGLQGVAITDHADIWIYEEADTYRKIQESTRQAHEAAEKYKDLLKVLVGVEMGESLYRPECAKELIGMTEYDVILASVHGLVFEDWAYYFSQIDFGPQEPEEKILRYLKQYYSDVYEMARYADFDVLCHLTCPLRYINGKYGRGIDGLVFEQEIKEILSEIIRRGIALEVNTSGVGNALGETMPNAIVLGWYRELGGEFITLASDAHVSTNIGNGFQETKDLLKTIGFTHYHYYEKRKPVEVLL